MKTSRRSFLGQAVAGATVEAARVPDSAGDRLSHKGGSEPPAQTVESSGKLDYPRVFEGRHITMIAFPLGGVGAGSISLGGRGQLRDWEIFNRADKGNNLPYAFPSIWVQAGDHKPIARVLEARYQPPYEGQDGLGSQNAPGLPRLASTRLRASTRSRESTLKTKSCPFESHSKPFRRSYRMNPTTRACLSRFCGIG